MHGNKVNPAGVRPTGSRFSICSAGFCGNSSHIHAGDGTPCTTYVAPAGTVGNDAAMGHGRTMGLFEEGSGTSGVGRGRLT